MTPSADIVDVRAVWQTVWTAAAAGVAVAVVFSLAVLGATRSLERQRAGRGGASLAYGVVALLAGAATLALMVVGVVLMATK